MEGRWASLALRARYEKAIDFERVTREDPQSLLVETLLIREQGRRSSLEMARLHYDLYLSLKDKNAVKEAVGWLEEMERVGRPWTRLEKPEDDGKSRDEKLIDYYNKVMAENADTKQTAV